MIVDRRISTCQVCKRFSQRWLTLSSDEASDLRQLPISESLSPQLDHTYRIQEYNTLVYMHFESDVSNIPSDFIFSS